MDIKTWFENGTGLTIKELRYLKMPTLPYNIFIDDIYIRGADKLNNIVEHNLTIEHYSETIDTINEVKIENFLNSENMHFNKSREWLQDESMYVTLYEIDTFIEKIRKDD